MDEFIASKKTIKSARNLFLKMQKYSKKSCDRIEKYRGKQYEVGQIVYPKDEESFPEPMFLKLLINSPYHVDKGWREGDAFVVSEVRVKPEYHWRVIDKVSGTAEKVLVYIPIYDLVKLDDPARVLRGLKPTSFLVLS